MAPAKRPWFRFYTEAIHDRKLRRRPPSERWLWVVLLAVARESEEPGVLLIGSKSATIADLADESALNEKEVKSGLDYFEAEGMLVRGPGETMVVRTFAARQYESDSSADRVAKHRRCNGLSSLHPPLHDSYGNGDVTTMKRSSSRAGGTESETEEPKATKSKAPPGAARLSPADPQTARDFVGFYVDECRSKGYDPVRQWRDQIGNQARRIGAEKPPDLIRSAIRIMADERKQPGVLAHVIADIEAGRSAHEQGP